MTRTNTLRWRGTGARSSLATVAMLLCALPGCKKRPEDQAAKARVFSPEEPVGAAAEAREKLDGARLGDDPRLVARVLHMPQEELAERLGPHRTTAKVDFRWTGGPLHATPAPEQAKDGSAARPGGQGSQDQGAQAQSGTDAGAESGAPVQPAPAPGLVNLSEQATLVQGHAGDFSLQLRNDRNVGFELFWVKGQAFVRGTAGPFRRRRSDRTDPQRLREQALAGLATFDRLARGLQLRAAGETTLEGRRAMRYEVAGGGAQPAPARAAAGGSDEDLPPAEYPLAPGSKKSGPDPDTARRLQVWEKEQPLSLSGSVVVDIATGAPLACDLQGRFRVPAEKPGQQPAELELHAVQTTQDIGHDPRLVAPAAEPEPSVPHAVKDPLRFWTPSPDAAPAKKGAASSEEPAAEPDATDEEGDPADEDPAQH